ncbi:surface protease GP63, putative,metallopeptidase, putative [Trypanosoma cruzi marinkellei]|uniref:Surface protease GP63, putative,metallopeptidase, putative n=1 Tax=Trypanosoma cruzi marinkellei TaxID=85056 RepID=K2MKE6_TRYCR|nr:surface protease GP63, putative,metallopeptidase, putative [Trypanosoma cruzi marinkellei]
MYFKIDLDRAAQMQMKRCVKQHLLKRRHLYCWSLVFCFIGLSDLVVIFLCCLFYFTLKSCERNVVCQDVPGESAIPIFSSLLFAIVKLSVMHIY